MSLLVTVAFVTGGFPTFRPPLEDEPESKAYEDRCKVEIEVEEDATLRQAFATALERIGAEPTEEWSDHVLDEDFPLVSSISFAAFYQGDPREDIRQERWRYAHNLLTVDESGLLRWDGGLDSTMADLRRAGDHGLIDGDPLRPYLILQPAAGNGIMLTWAALLTAWTLARGILGGAADVEGALALRERIRRRLEAGGSVVEGNLVQWSERGAQPVTFIAALKREPWLTADLSMLLGITDEQTVALLEAFGFERNDDERWSISSDEEGRLLRLLEEDVFEAFAHGLNPELAFHERFTTLIETGERAPTLLDEYASIADEDDVVPDDLDLEDDDDDLVRLPLEVTRFDCGCEAKDCQASLKVLYTAGEQTVRFELRNVEDHFVLKPSLLLMIALQVAEDAEQLTD